MLLINVFIIFRVGPALGDILIDPLSPQLCFGIQNPPPPPPKFIINLISRIVYLQLHN